MTPVLEEAYQVNSEKLEEVKDESHNHGLAELAYGSLLVELEIRSLDILQFMHNKIGYACEKGFLCRFHDTYLELRQIKESDLSQHHSILLNALRAVYRNNQRLKQSKLTYLTRKEETQQLFEDMKAEITSGRGPKEPVRFMSIWSAFTGRETCQVSLKELSEQLNNSVSDADESQKRKYASSSISWFNKTAERLNLPIRIDAIKNINYYINIQS